MLYIKKDLFQYQVNLAGDIKYVMVFDMNYDYAGKIQLFGEYIQIGKGKTFLINKPLISVNPIEYQVKNKIIDKGHFARFLDERVKERRSVYLKQLGNVLQKEIKEYLVNNRFPEINNEVSKFDESKKEWILINKKWKWLYMLFEDNDDDKN